jgi:hypothetical protein
MDANAATSSTVNAAKGNWDPVFRYHFPIDPMTGRVTPGSAAAWSPVRVAAGLHELGRGLHTLQDSFGHRGAYRGNIVAHEKTFGLKAKLAVAWEERQGELSHTEQGVTHDIKQEWVARFGLRGAAHATDWTFVDSDVLMSAAQATLRALLEFQSSGSRLDVDERFAALWPGLRTVVREFATAASVAEKKEWFVKYFPAALLGMPWEDLSLP